MTYIPVTPRCVRVRATPEQIASAEAQYQRFAQAPSTDLKVHAGKSMSARINRSLRGIAIDAQHGVGQDADAKEKLLDKAGLKQTENDPGYEQGLAGVLMDKGDGC